MFILIIWQTNYKVAILLLIPAYKMVDPIVGSILTFWPHFNLFAGESIQLAKPVCILTGLLACQVNWPANKPVRTFTLIIFLIKYFKNINNRRILTYTNVMLLPINHNPMD